MAYLKTSASDWRDLLAVIKAFAVGAGWTSVYDQIAAKGQLGLSKGNCFISIGSIRNSGDTADATTFNQTDAVFGGTIVDTRIVMALGTSLTAGTTRYWGHPGSLVTTYNDTDRIECNDLTGAFTNVWLFAPADGNAIHVVVQVAAERYTHLTFGNLDVKGLNQPRCGYCAGVYYVYWPNTADYTSNTSYYPNYVQGGVHNFGILGADAMSMVMIPSGLLNTSYTWGVTAPVVNRTGVMDLMPTVGDTQSDHLSSNAGKPLEFFMAVDNQETTGGIPLHALPFIFENGTSDTGIAAWLGEIPDCRLVNMRGLNPGQEISYAGDIWTVFPFKQKGIYENSNFGSNQTPTTNTLDYGVAFKKVA